VTTARPSGVICAGTTAVQLPSVEPARSTRVTLLFESFSSQALSTSILAAFLLIPWTRQNPGTVAMCPVSKSVSRMCGSAPAKATAKKSPSAAHRHRHVAELAGARPHPAGGVGQPQLGRAVVVALVVSPAAGAVRETGIEPALTRFEFGEQRPFGADHQFVRHRRVLGVAVLEQGAVRPSHRRIVGFRRPFLNGVPRWNLVVRGHIDGYHDDERR